MLRLFSVLCLCVLTACGSYNALKERRIIAHPAGEYLLGAGDKVMVNVFNEPELSGEFMIDETGAFSQPLVGTIMAKGRTVRELEKAITNKLRGTYLRRPQVSAEIIEYRPFYVIGQVNSQGEYEYKPGLNAINAIAIAGGFTPRANKDVVAIKQHGKTGEKLYELNDTIMVMPGDTVHVKPRYF